MTANSKIKCAVFDLDGTLLDTLDEISYIANLSMTSFGLNVVSKENVRKYVGDGSRNLIMRMARETKEPSKAEFEKLHESYLKLYLQYEGQRVKTFPNVEELLEKLQKEKVVLAILSNKPTANVVNAVKKYYPSIKFDCILGNGDGIKLKPDPEGLEMIAQEFSLSKEQILYIGDGDADVLVAKNFGCLGVFVLWGNREKEELEKLGGEYFVNYPLEILKFI